MTSTTSEIHPKVRLYDLLKEFERAVRERVVVGAPLSQKDDQLTATNFNVKRDNLERHIEATFKEYDRMHRLAVPRTLICVRIVSEITKRRFPNQTVGDAVGFATEVLEALGVE